MMIVVTTMAVAILCAAITFGASRGKIPSNSAIGIRTYATQRNEAAWVNAHRAAANIVVPSSAAILVSGVVVSIGVTRPWGQLEIQGAVLLGLLVISIIWAAIVAQRAALKTL